MPREILFLRTAAANLQERDPHLTHQGILQAESLRGALGSLTEYDGILCSPLARAYETLEDGIPGIEVFPVYLDDRLMDIQTEICNCRADLLVLQTRVPRRWILTGLAEENPFGRERGLEERVREFGEYLAERWAGKRLLVVGHYDWIREWFRQSGWCGDLSLSNCDIVRWSMKR